MIYMKSPTEKQINLVEAICKAFHITNFPMSSKEFNRYVYSQFISKYINDFYDAIDARDLDEDDCNEFCVNDVWCEEY